MNFDLLVRDIERLSLLFKAIKLLLLNNIYLNPIRWSMTSVLDLDTKRNAFLNCGGSVPTIGKLYLKTKSEGWNS